MNFKPTIWKIIVAVIFVLIWILIASNFGMMNSGHPTYTCRSYMSQYQGVEDYKSYNKYLISGTFCGPYPPTSFFEMILRNLSNTLLPFIIIYVPWSFIQKKRNKKPKK